MTASWKEILDQVSGPGDLATILIAGSVGYTLDAGLNFAGFMDPGVVGIIAASAALGVKKAIEAAQERRVHSAKATAERTRIALDDQASRAQRLVELFDSEGRTDLVARLKREILLLEADRRVPEAVTVAIDEIVDSYRHGPAADGRAPMVETAGEEQVSPASSCSSSKA